MNQMALINYIFLFKLIIDLKNIGKNKSILKQEEETGFFVNFDSKGRAVFGHQHCNDEDKYVVQLDSVPFTEQMVKSPNHAQGMKTVWKRYP